MSVQLTFDSLSIADIRVTALHGRKKIGGYRLAFTLEVKTLAWTQSEHAVTIDSWSVVVMCGPRGGALQLLGSATPEYMQVVKTYNFPGDTNFLCFVELTADQLSMLEIMRAGGDLSFNFNVMCLCSGQIGSNPSPTSSGFYPTYRTWTPDRKASQAVISYDTNINEWQRVLKELDYLDVMTFSISIPSNPAPEQLQSAQRMLRQAQDHFLHGRYEEVVSVSRKLMESIRDALGQGQAIKEAVRKFKDDKESMTKSERSLVVQEAVRHYSHPAHHVDKATGHAEWYSRDDAMFVLATSSAVFAEALASCLN